MSGNKWGGRKSAATHKVKYGDDYFAKIGKLGGSAKVPKGFALMDSKKVSEAGRKGGTISKRRGRV